MTSSSASASASSDCCLPTSCACTDWLTVFCDYVPATVSYCGVSNDYVLARSLEIPQESQNPNAGVFAADHIFEVSMEEFDMDIGIGATVTDDAGTEWLVYRVQYVRTFCTKKLWCRSVAACFTLLDDIEVYSRSCGGDGCGQDDTLTLVGCVKGRIRAERGVAVSRNDSNDVRVTYGGALTSWPVSDQLPSGFHRIKVRGGCDLYRIQSFTDDGLFAPFRLVLEKDSAECQI